MMKKLQPSERIHLVLSSLAKELSKQGYDVKTDKTRHLDIKSHGTIVSLQQQSRSGWSATPLDKLTLSISAKNYFLPTKTYPEPKVGFLDKTHLKKTISRIKDYADNVKKAIDKVDYAVHHLTLAKLKLALDKKPQSEYESPRLDVNGIHVRFSQNLPTTFHFSFETPIDSNLVVKIIRAISKELPTDILDKK
jgi:hypothetical protein